MHRQRVLVAFAVAWIVALLLSWFVYKRTTAPQKREVVQVVAAAKDLQLGKRLDASDLKLLTLDRQNLPKGVFLKTADVLDRSLTAPLASNELVLTTKVAAKGGGEGMTAMIEKGMRAVSVQVNDISGVSGFIQPGTRVDVLFTRVFSNSDAATVTILQNIKVIAYGKQLEPQAVKPDARDAANRNTVATLLVTEQDAQKLALAIQRGHVQLVLRNPLDEEISEEFDPVRSEDLGIKEPAKPVPVRAAPPPRPVVVPAPPKPPVSGAGVEQHVGPANDGSFVVQVYRGNKISQDVFEHGKPIVQIGRESGKENNEKQ